MSRTLVRILGSQRTARAWRTSRALLGAAVMAIGLTGQNASAGVFADELSRCLVKSSSTDDRVLLVQWMFAALSLHPAVQPMISVKLNSATSPLRKQASFSRDC